MCGILGAVGYGGNSKTFEGALGLLAHRGPDANAVYKGRLGGAAFYLGHTRLSIIDLSQAANQPFEKDGWVIAFNGEIYNYRALRKELESQGAVFHTTSDTEVLLEAWRYWGKACLNKLRGMFAFALYNKAQDELILARDPFGIKPLFYSHQNGQLIFASELKALVPLLDQKPAINRKAVTASLLYVWVPDAEVIYTGVEKVQQGELLIYKSGQLSKERYWSAHEELVMQTPPPVSVEGLRTVMEDSVRAHMVADVPVGSFLSGGLDSSLISVMAARQGREIDCYTIVTRGQDAAREAMPQDLPYARKVAAAEPNLRLHEIEVTPNVVEMLPRLAGVMDEPVGDAAIINVLLMCQAARAAGTKVLLSGMGADEMFAGYRRHYACLLANRFRRLPGGVKAPVRGVVNMLPVASRAKGFRTIRWAKRFMEMARLDEAAAYHRSYTYYNRDDLQALTKGAAQDIEALFEAHQHIYEAGPANDQVGRMCYTDVQMFMNGLNLPYTDRASMAASCEVRVPFVDTHVASAAFSLSGAQKIRGRHGKYILKKAAEAYLPKEVVWRPKASFGLPLRAWLRGALKDFVGDMLPNGQLIQQGFVQQSVLEKMIEDNQAGRQDYAQHLWQLLTIETWLRHHT